MVWLHLKILWHGEDNYSAVDSDRSKKERKIEDMGIIIITSKNGQERGFEIPLGQQKTGKGGKVLLQRHLWWPDDRQV